MDVFITAVLLIFLKTKALGVKSNHRKLKTYLMAFLAWHLHNELSILAHTPLFLRRSLVSHLWADAAESHIIEVKQYVVDLFVVMTALHTLLNIVR